MGWFLGILVYPSASINRYTKAVVGHEVSNKLQRQQFWSPKIVYVVQYTLLWQKGKGASKHNNCSMHNQQRKRKLDNKTKGKERKDRHSNKERQMQCTELTIYFLLNIIWVQAHILFNKSINSRPILNAVVQYSFSPVWNFD